MKLLQTFIIDVYRYAHNRLIVNIFLMIISGLTSSFGIVMLIPLLSLTGIVGYSTTRIPFLADLIKFLNSYNTSTQLLIVLAIYITIISFQAILNRKLSILNVEIIQGYTKYLRISLFEKTVRADWSCLMNKKGSDITNSFSLEIGRIAAGTIYLLKIISQIILAFFQLAVSFLLSPLFTLFVLICGSVIFIYLNSTLKESKKLGTSLQKINQNLFSQITEQLNGVKEIKSYGIEQTQLTSFTETITAIEKNSIDYAKVQSYPDFYYKISAAMAISLFFYFAINYFNVEPSAMLIIIFIFSRLWPIFSAFQNNLQNIFIILPSYTSLKVLESELLINAENFSIINDNSEHFNMKNSVIFQDINFKYKTNSESFEIKNLDFEIKAKTIFAFVGRSGAGKSTIVDLLLGLLKPDSGKIIVDGVNIDHNLMKKWRKSIGYVPQDPFLLNNTIRENLLRFSPSATENELIESLQLASAMEFVSKLPLGLETYIGDRGVKLSGGERQRIVLARALLRKPAMLILDEATSALDTENEYNILKAVEALRGKLTVIVIAHRLSTIKNADNIVIVDKGKIVEKGTYNDLSQKQGGYFKKMLDINH